MGDPADTDAATQESAFDWEDHLRLTRADPPKAMLLRALRHARTKAHALDLGAGALNDSRHLLSIGFERVTALDATRPSGSELAGTSRFQFVHSKFEDYAFPVAAFDFINAQFSLPFTPPDRFAAVFDGVISALQPGGIFVGELFGNRDEWAADTGMTFHEPAEASALLARDADFLYFAEEEDWRGTLASGEKKHWHILYFIVRKRE